MKHALLFASLVAVAACGGKSKPATTTGPTDQTTMAWADMDHEQREKYMEDVVMPAMKEKFVAFDGAKYADMDCGTCHIAPDDHKMPNPNLPKLDFSKKEEDYTPEEAKVGEFMGTVVVPEMAKLLGTTPYDPATQQGFGCLGCHTTTDAK